MSSKHPNSQVPQASQVPTSVPIPPSVPLTEAQHSDGRGGRPNSKRKRAKPAERIESSVSSFVSDADASPWCCRCCVGGFNDRPTRAAAERGDSRFSSRSSRDSIETEPSSFVSISYTQTLDLSPPHAPMSRALCETRESAIRT